MEFPISFGIHKIGLPLIPISYNSNLLIMLLDTGASSSYIFKVACDGLDIEYSPCNNKTYALGGDGGSIGISTLNFTFEDKEYEMQATVVDCSESVNVIQEESGVQLHGIIGVDFMIKHQWKIDFETFTLSSLQ